MSNSNCAFSSLTLLCLCVCVLLACWLGSADSSTCAGAVESGSCPHHRRNHRLRNGSANKRSAAQLRPLSCAVLLIPSSVFFLFAPDRHQQTGCSICDPSHHAEIVGVLLSRIGQSRERRSASALDCLLHVRNKHDNKERSSIRLHARSCSLLCCCLLVTPTSVTWSG